MKHFFSKYSRLFFHAFHIVLALLGLYGTFFLVHMTMNQYQNYQDKHLSKARVSFKSKTPPPQVKPKVKKQKNTPKNKSKAPPPSMTLLAGSASGFSFSNHQSRETLFADESQKETVFNSSQIDQKPVLKRKGYLKYPEGKVEKIALKVNALINKEGKVEEVIVLGDVQANIKESAQLYVSTSLFTPPMKQGIPVNAWFKVPVEFR